MPRVPKRTTDTSKEKIQELKEIREGVYLARITNDWLPLPTEALKQLGWTEGTEIELLPIMNGQVVLRKKDALKD